MKPGPRHCERSEASQLWRGARSWMASSRRAPRHEGALLSGPGFGRGEKPAFGWAKAPLRRAHHFIPDPREWWAHQRPARSRGPLALPALPRSFLAAHQCFIRLFPVLARGRADLLKLDRGICCISSKVSADPACHRRRDQDWLPRPDDRPKIAALPMKQI